MHVFPKSTHSRANIPSCRSRAVKALVLVLGLLVGASQSYATNLTWTNANGTFSTAENWNPAQAPADADVTIFTNDTSYTVSFTGNTPVMQSCTFTGHAGTVTLDLGSSTWFVTNQFRVGRADATSTVYLASGTLSVAGTVVATAQLRIGDPATNGYNAVGTLIVTNGTVVIDSGLVGNAVTNTGPSTGVGTLIITGTGQMIDNGSGSTLTIGAGTSVGSRLIVTNGGKLTVDGTLTIGANQIASNNFALFSGPTSRGTMTSQGIRMSGDSGLLIISNGAKVFMGNQGSIGANSSYNTGIVVGAGSELIINGASGLQVGLNSSGGTNNNLTVYDGGRLTCNGTLAYGNNTFHVNDGIQIGGPGLMSTGFAQVVRETSQNTNHFGGYVTVTNAFFSCNYLNPQSPRGRISVLANGTWMFTNGFANGQAGPSSNGINVGGSSIGSVVLINGGTLINLLSTNDNNPGGISIAGATLTPAGNSLIVTNGGKLLTSMGTIGAATSFNTGIVVGVGSVWSNFSGPAGFTNFLIVGTGAGGSNNYFTVRDGATLYNNGTFTVGNASAASSNNVIFGGPGVGSTVINIQGALCIGRNSSPTNALTITNATVNCATIHVGTDTITTPSFTFTTNDIAGALVVTNFCMSTNDLVATILTNCSNSSTSTGAVFNTLTLSSGTLTGGLIQVHGTNTLVYNGGVLGFTTLRVDGNTLGAATINVPSGSMLQGVGYVANPVTIDGTLAPGGSVGTLTISNNLVLNSTAVLSYEMGSTGNADKAAVVGNLTLDGVLNVTTNNTDGLFGVGNYTLITYTGTLTDNILATGTMPGPGFNYAIVAGGGSVVLQVTAAGGGDPYTTWASFYNLGGNAAGGADPDGDGMSNTNEFLAGFNPTNSAAYVHVISIARTSTTNITVTYLGANGDSNGSLGPKANVLESTLGTGNGSYTTTNFVSTGQTNILSGGNGLGTVTSFVHTNGATGATRYYRVRVLVP